MLISGAKSCRAAALICAPLLDVVFPRVEVGDKDSSISVGAGVMGVAEVVDDSSVAESVASPVSRELLGRVGVSSVVKSETDDNSSVDGVGACVGENSVEGACDSGIDGSMDGVWLLEKSVEAVGVSGRGKSIDDVGLVKKSVEVGCCNGREEVETARLFSDKNGLGLSGFSIGF